MPWAGGSPQHAPHWAAAALVCGALPTPHPALCPCPVSVSVCMGLGTSQPEPLSAVPGLGVVAHQGQGGRRDGALRAVWTREGSGSSAGPGLDHPSSAVSMHTHPRVHTLCLIAHI